MRYVGRNLFLFIKEEKMIFLFLILSVFSSVLLLHFSYSVYQSYMVQKEEDLSEQMHLPIYFRDSYEEKIQDAQTGDMRIAPLEGQEYLTVRDLKAWISEMSQELQENILALFVRADVSGYPLCFSFAVQDQKIVRSEYYMKNMDEKSIVDGRFFTEEEYREGLPVALAYADTTGTNMKKMLSADGTTLRVGGRTYEVIGLHDFYPDQPIIPITSLEEDTTLYGGIDLDFADPMTSREYQEICKLTSTYFGDHASVGEVNLPDEEKIYMYNTMILAAILISMVAALNFAIMYRYVLQSRKREIRILQICGMNQLRAAAMYIAECLLATLPVYLAAVVLYAKVFLRVVNRHFSYINESYSLRLYGILFAFYYGCSLVILTGMIFWHLNRAEGMRIGGGCR